jgi:hypothetical protein
MTTKDSNMTTSAGTVGESYPFRLWWGLAACAAVMALILLLAPYSDGSEFGPDRGDFWYAWQLAEPTFWTRLSAWLPYCAHQLAIWFLITKARQVRPRYIFGLHSLNAWALGINGFFVLLHIAQTKFFYDGLAQDVHEATSMMSVVLMLFMILIMENGRRGMFFGRPMPLMEGVGDTLRRYHGYYFSWAIIYTFWYHPVEMTQGHLAGFAYMMLLLLQSSLFFTRFHVNRWWTVSLETLFVVHGALVAYFIMQKGQDGPWSMFLFGGIAVFLITQMHGLGLSWKAKLGVATPLVAILTVFYSNFPEHLMGLTRLPMIMYIGAVLMCMMIWALLWIGRIARSAANLGPEGS